MRRLLLAALVAGIVSVMAVATATAHEDHSTDEWPMTCVDLNDIVEEHLGNPHNVGIYQNTFDDQAEAACQNDHRNDVTAVFGWAIATETGWQAQATDLELDWPTTCVELNDIVEGHLGNQGNVAIYQNTFGDQAEAACQNDHRNDVRSVFAWAIGTTGAAPPPAPPAPTPSPPTSSLPLVAPALYSAVWRGRTETVRALVAGGANVNVRTSDNDPLLHEAIWRNRTGIVQILVAAGADVNARDSDGDPLLHEAIWRGHTEIVRILVAAGADVNARASDGDSLLYEATWRGHTDIVQILVDAGAGG